MSEKRFGYGETDLFEWVEDNGKMISTKECVNKLNEQQEIIKNLYDEIHSLKKIIKEQTLRVYCQDQEIQKLTRQLQKIPPNIRDVWLE